MTKLEIIKEMLKDTEEISFFYWINALVKLGDITKSEAGYLLFYKDKR